MIVERLKLVLEEADVVARLQKGLASVGQVKDVSFSLVPGAVRVGGRFQAGLAIPFETRWSVALMADGRLGVRLAGVSVGFFGLSAETVTSQIMGALAQRLQNVSGIAVEGDTLVLDPAVLLAEKGVRLGGAINRVEVKQGGVEIEVGGA